MFDKTTVAETYTSRIAEMVYILQVETLLQKNAEMLRFESEGPKKQRNMDSLRLDMERISMQLAPQVDR